MNTLKLNEEDLVARCLRAALNERIFLAVEFHALIGLFREQLQGHLDRDGQEVPEWVVNNVLFMLLTYPHGKQAVLVHEYGVTKHQIRAILDRVIAEGRQVWT